MTGLSRACVRLSDIFFSISWNAGACVSIHACVCVCWLPVSDSVTFTLSSETHVHRSLPSFRNWYEFFSLSLSLRIRGINYIKPIEQNPKSKALRNFFLHWIPLGSVRWNFDSTGISKRKEKKICMFISCWLFQCQCYEFSACVFKVRLFIFKRINWIQLGMIRGISMVLDGLNTGFASDWLVADVLSSQCPFHRFLLSSTSTYMHCSLFQVSIWNCLNLFKVWKER